tara:strand:- start:454 stop:603 length:150 start_codon:yes stop_codon:yes gene_type:complete
MGVAHLGGFEIEFDCFGQYERIGTGIGIGGGGWGGGVAGFDIKNVESRH